MVDDIVYQEHLFDIRLILNFFFVRKIKSFSASGFYKGDEHNFL